MGGVKLLFILWNLWLFSAPNGPTGPTGATATATPTPRPTSPTKELWFSISTSQPSVFDYYDTDTGISIECTLRNFRCLKNKTILVDGVVRTDFIFGIKFIFRDLTIDQTRFNVLTDAKLNVFRNKIKLVQYQLNEGNVKVHLVVNVEK
jgi:hypothetical protein